MKRQSSGLVSQLLYNLIDIAAQKKIIAASKAQIIPWVENNSNSSTHPACSRQALLEWPISFWHWPRRAGIRRPTSRKTKKKVAYNRKGTNTRRGVNQVHMPEWPWKHGSDGGDRSKVAHSSVLWECCSREEFPPAEPQRSGLWTITKFLMWSSRRFAHPWAILLPHLRARFCLKKPLASDKPISLYSLLCTCRRIYECERRVPARRATEEWTVDYYEVSQVFQ